MKNIILASTSPRRRELLTLAGVKFEVLALNVDESVPEGTSPEDAVEMTARKKAMAIAERHGRSIVIGADTVVVCDGKILGKPKSKKEAVEMLKMLSGREHLVMTGVCIAHGGETEIYHVVTKVKFYELSNKDINDYVNTGEPMDKAGAYGIQGRGCVLVESIEGDYFNIVGLPISSLCRKLKKLENKYILKCIIMMTLIIK